MVELGDWIAAFDADGHAMRFIASCYGSDAQAVVQGKIIIPKPCASPRKNRTYLHYCKTVRHLQILENRFSFCSFIPVREMTIVQSHNHTTWQNVSKSLYIVGCIESCMQQTLNFVKNLSRGAEMLICQRTS